MPAKNKDAKANQHLQSSIMKGESCCNPLDGSHSIDTINITPDKFEMVGMLSPSGELLKYGTRRYLGKS